MTVTDKIIFTDELCWSHYIALMIVITAKLHLKLLYLRLRLKIISFDEKLIFITHYIRYAYLDDVSIFQDSDSIILSGELWGLYILVGYSSGIFHRVTLLSHTFLPALSGTFWYLPCNPSSIF